MMKRMISTAFLMFLVAFVWGCSEKPKTEEPAKEPTYDVEAKSNLRAIRIAAISYYGSTDSWANSTPEYNSFELMFWAPVEKTKSHLAYFYNSCDVVEPSSDGFKECPPALRNHFQKNANPLTGFIAGSVYKKKDGAYVIWVIDQNEKDPKQLK